MFCGTIVVCGCYGGRFVSLLIVCERELQWVVCDVVSDSEHSTDNTAALHAATQSGRCEGVHTVTSQHRPPCMYHTDTQTVSHIDRQTHTPHIHTEMMYMLLHRVDAVRAFILSQANIDHLVCTTHTQTISHIDRQTHTPHRQTEMMYMLLHRVDAVRAFILSRANIDHLVCTTHTQTDRHDVHATAQSGRCEGVHTVTSQHRPPCMYHTHTDNLTHRQTDTQTTQTDRDDVHATTQSGRCEGVHTVTSQHRPPCMYHTHIHTDRLTHRQTDTQTTQTGRHDVHAATLSGRYQ